MLITSHCTRWPFGWIVPMGRVWELLVEGGRWCGFPLLLAWYRFARRAASRVSLCFRRPAAWCDLTRPCVSGASTVWVISEELRQLADVEQELSELGDAFGAELLRPGGFDLGDGFADHADRRVAAFGEGDAF